MTPEALYKDFVRLVTPTAARGIKQKLILGKTAKDMLAPQSSFAFSEVTEVVQPLREKFPCTCCRSVYQHASHCEETLKAITEYIPAVVLSSWAFGKSVYKFDDLLLQGLQTSKIPDVFSVIHRVPEYCFYIEINGLYGFEGIFIMVNYDVQFDNATLFVVKHKGVQLKFDIVPLHKDFLHEKWDVLKLGESTKFALNLVCYLCADNADIRFQNRQLAKPSNLAPPKGKYGKRFAEASKVRHWHVGVEMGDRVRRAMREYTAERKVTPHLRRAHWQGYWVGKGRVDYRLNWVPATVVGAPLED